MLFFPIIVLPLLIEKGMLDWHSGILMTTATLATMFTSKFAYKFAEKFSYNLNWVLGTTMQGLLLILAGIFSRSWQLVALLFIFFNFFDGLWQPAWNHILAEQTEGKTIATTRSVIFSVFALYITIGKQLLSAFSAQSVKYEEVYLKNYATPLEAIKGLKDYFHFYNHARPHQSLGYQTPAQIYFKTLS